MPPILGEASPEWLKAAASVGQSCSVSALLTFPIQAFRLSSQCPKWGICNSSSFRSLPSRISAAKTLRRLLTSSLLSFDCRSLCSYSEIAALWRATTTIADKMKQTIKLASNRVLGLATEGKNTAKPSLMIAAMPLIRSTSHPMPIHVSFQRLPHKSRMAEDCNGKRKFLPNAVPSFAHLSGRRLSDTHYYDRNICSWRAPDLCKLRFGWG
jgi:hypothetical protein